MGLIEIIVLTAGGVVTTVSCAGMWLARALARQEAAEKNRIHEEVLREERDRENNERWEIARVEHEKKVAARQLLLASLPEHETQVVYGTPECPMCGYTGSAEEKLSVPKGPPYFRALYEEAKAIKDVYVNAHKGPTTAVAVPVPGGFRMWRTCTSCHAEWFDTSPAPTHRPEKRERKKS